MAAAANAGPELAATGASVSKRPGAGGLKWSEVCQTVQHSDGSVRTFKGACSAVSPPRPRPVGLGKCNFTKVTNTAASPWREGTSRGGSSGKSSRSSSRDPLARDGDVSSRCSSCGWDTSTNSSEMSRPRTPRDAAPSPSATGLLMPNPIRTTQMLPPALLDEMHETKAHDTNLFPQEKGPSADDAVLPTISEHRPGVGLKWDPFGRDCRPLEGKKSHEKQELSPEPLVKYLQGVVAQIDANLQNHCVPTSDKLEDLELCSQRQGGRHNGTRTEGCAARRNRQRRSGLWCQPGIACGTAKASETYHCQYAALNTLQQCLLPRFWRRATERARDAVRDRFH